MKCRPMYMPDGVIRENATEKENKKVHLCGRSGYKPSVVWLYSRRRLMLGLIDEKRAQRNQAKHVTKKILIVK